VEKKSKEVVDGTWSKKHISSQSGNGKQKEQRDGHIGLLIGPETKQRRRQQKREKEQHSSTGCKRSFRFGGRRTNRHCAKEGKALTKKTGLPDIQKTLWKRKALAIQSTARTLAPKRMKGSTEKT